MCENCAAERIFTAIAERRSSLLKNERQSVKADKLPRKYKLKANTVGVSENAYQLLAAICCIYRSFFLYFHFLI